MYRNSILCFILLAFITLPSCKENKKLNIENSETSIKSKNGMIEWINYDPSYGIDSLTKVEVLDSGFIWSEGPLWLPTENKLIFSDVPSNKIYQWSENNGTSLYLQPSGYTSQMKREGEPGSNGLILDATEKLILCQHGDRRVARMESPLSSPKPIFSTLAGNFEGKKFNSPNDLTLSSSGKIYFTDPPYGLAFESDREITYQGVYCLFPGGKVSLLTKELTRPNGVAISPDEKFLYVANSDPNAAFWMVYPLDDETGSIKNGSVFYDATTNVKNEKGLPDGMKVRKDGTLFATGPGGVWIFSPEAKLLGKIKTGEATSNCAFNDDESILYMTADDYLMRINLTSHGSN